MSENKTLYIEQLLNEIKSLHESVHEVNNSGDLPFSFFKESFKKTQEITGLLHKLEFIQVEDLKSKMERLVFVLTEKEKEKEQEMPEDKDLEIDPELPEVKKEESIDTERGVFSKKTGNKYAEGIVLPEYRKPYSSDDNSYKKHDTHNAEEHNYNNIGESDKSVSRTIDNSNKNSRSFNDLIKTSPSVVDLKRGISLNDRFLFQRELFGNDRNRMNATIKKLNDFRSYKEAEEYIIENVSEDLENPIVKDFLSIIRKEFNK